MPVRKLSLSEWFLDYQLQSVKQDHFILPFTLDVDLARLVEPWRAAGERPPVPSIIIKAVAVLATERPVINRMLFRTLLGPRVIEFDGQHVNVPVLLEHEGRDYLTAVTIRDAAALSVAEISARLREARKQDVRALMINRLFIEDRNTWLRRLQLRVMHYLAYRVPWAYERGGGGGLAVSSLWHRRRESMVARGVSMGPNAFTVLVLGTDGEGADERLQLGISFDHGVLSGDGFLEILGTFSDILADPVRWGLGPDASGNATP